MSETLETELNLSCPYCPAGKESKLFVNLDKRVFNCFRCGFSGKLEWLIHKHPDLFSRIEDFISLSTFNRLKTFVDSSKHIKFDSSVMSELKSVSYINEEDPHYAYLVNRGWEKWAINYYRPYKSKTEKFINRVIVPVLNSENKVIYFTARDITGKSKLKYLNPVRDKDFIFTSKTPLNSVYQEDAFVCEGIFDSFKIPSACALLGKTLAKAQHKPLYQFLKSRKRIYICLDPGTEKEANKLAIEIDSWFVDKEIYVMNWVSTNSKIDLGDLSKHCSQRQLVSFIQDTSSKAKLLKIV